MKVHIGKCNDNLFIVLPAETVTQLQWSHGDIVDVELEDKSLKVTRTMTAHDHAMEIAHRMMDEYRETLEALAKS